MENIQDRIFGDLNAFESRVGRHQQSLFGIQHASHRVPMGARPGEAVLLRVTTSMPDPLIAVRGWYTTDDTDPAGGLTLTIEFERASTSWDNVLWGYFQTWEAVIPPQDEGVLVRYKIGACTPGGKWIYADGQNLELEAARIFSYLVSETGVPTWAREAMVYHVFIDRFYPGEGAKWLSPPDPSGFYGGTLRGVIEKLDYIQELGFNAIWLSPLFPSPSHHGYDATDYEQVEPRLGTRADLKALIARAHERGLRVIMDFVANHWSSLHPTFKDAQRDRSSPYYDWYLWNSWPDDYQTYFEVKNLPRLNLELGSPARAYLLKIAQFWLEQGVDGYRLDHAEGPPDDFWVDFRQACRAADPDCWLFGEIVNTAERQRVYQGVFDGILDFHLAHALRQTFALRAWDLAEFEAFLQAHEGFFPPEFGRPAFLDNHDMNRFLFLSGGDTGGLKLAALVLFTLAQPPVLYYGTEVGVTQERPVHQGDRGLFEEARLPMKWDDAQDKHLQAYFRTLITLRKGAPALVYGDRRLVHLDQETLTYGYFREFGDEQILVVVNAGDLPHAVKIPLSLPLNVRDRLSDQNISHETGFVVLEMAPRSGAVVF